MTEFKEDNLTTEDAFWVIWYFLLEHYELGKGKIELNELLSFCEPLDWAGTGEKLPSNSSMVDYWNEALDKFRKEGKQCSSNKTQHEN